MAEGEAFDGGRVGGGRRVEERLDEFGVAGGGVDGGVCFVCDCVGGIRCVNVNGL